jgi:hypothetical protein
MSRHLIYAVIENTGGYKKIDGKFVETPEAVHHYLKAFQDKDAFEKWMDAMSPENGGHCRVVKWWWDRPPCVELAQIKEQYKETWIKL